MRSQSLVSTRTAIAGATGNAAGRPGGGRRTGPALVLDLPPERPA
ncbi:hypothetical protein AB0I85_24395 [Micromonospora echinofusca]